MRPAVTRWLVVTSRVRRNRTTNESAAIAERVTAESFHVDNSPSLREGDEVFGMLCNLNATSFRFGCVPGTHLNVPPWELRGCFDKIADPVLLARYKATQEDVEVPPGCAVVFYQHIVHYIWTPLKGLVENMYRLTGGVFLTDGEDHPFRAQYTAAVSSQGVPCLKSGQIPPLFARMHRACFTDKEFTMQHVPRTPAVKRTLREWSEVTFKDVLLVPEPQSGRRVVQRFAPSLRELKLPLYPAYTEEEKAVVLRTARAFVLRGADGCAREYSL